VPKKPAVANDGGLFLFPRHCGRSEAIQTAYAEALWIASSLRSSQ
jgi:hypothetical protein